MYIKPEFEAVGSTGDLKDYRVISASKEKDGTFTFKVELTERKVSHMKLQGNKTYIVAAVSVAYALSGLFLGKIGLEEAINYLLGAGALVGIRSALNK